MRPISKVNPPIYESTTPFSKLIRCLKATKSNPANEAINVEIRMGKKTSVGESAPDLKAKIEMGIIVSPEVFNTKNII